ncbi:peptidoglycan-binding protein [Streptomyces monticola]|uniref:Peptidoglycan-binding protein n=1 Tax=Streptomyces monticola TaxID=2666263 RepID=A0ABW2JB02_9ACTN
MDPVFGHVAPPDAGEPLPLNDADLELFEFERPAPGALPEEVAAGPRQDVPEFSRSAPGPSGRGWRYGLVAGAAAVVLVTAGVASGFFSSGPDTDDQAGPPGGAGESVSVPDSSSPSPSSTKSERASRSSQRPTSSPSVSESVTPSSSAPPTTSQPPSSASSTAAKPTPTSQRPSEDAEDDGPQVLSRGDHGDQVVELQQRLQQLQLYIGPVNGNYSADVEDAVERFQQARQIDEEPGVYGPATRAAVEAETSDPS